MNEGAMGLGSSLIYAPATFAETPELIALATASAQCGGMYISHMRNESDHVLEAVDELIAIARASGGPAEIYHLKQAGSGNWDKLDGVIQRVVAGASGDTAKKAESAATADAPRPPSTPPADLSIPRDKVAQRAYEVWVRKGKPFGTSDQDWLQAEAELQAELAARPDGEPLPNKPR